MFDILLKLHLHQLLLLSTVFLKIIIFSHGTSVSREVAILIPKNIKIDLNILSTKKDTQGRILIIECKLEEKICILVNIYAPTNDKPNEQIFFSYKIAIAIL